MPTFLGFLTALLVTAWGTQWYLAQHPVDWRALLQRARQSLPAREEETPPLVPREAADKLLRRQPEGTPQVVDVVPEKAATPTKAAKAAPPKAAEPTPAKGTRPKHVAPTAPPPPDEIVIEATTPPKGRPADLPEATPDVIDHQPRPTPATEARRAETSEVVAEEEPAAPPPDAEEPPPPPPAPREAAADEGTSEEDEATDESDEDESTEEEVIGFCARCREKRPVTDAKRTRTKKGKPAIRGKCGECGAGMFVFTSEWAE